jgi:sigma-E factor negative regulatory protein RseB
MRLAAEVSSFRVVPAWGLAPGRMLAVALALVGGLASAQPATVPEPARLEPSLAKDVRSWLSRIQEAPSRSNFEGTFVVTVGGAVSSARIVHFQDGVNQYERIESLDGKARQVFRHNNLVTTFWPQTRVALVEEREKLSSFPALLRRGDDRIADYYDVRLHGIDRIAGLDAHVLSLTPRDPYRFGYKLWADKDSGLLLRADVIGERSELLESTAFSDVSIGVRSQPELVTKAMKKLTGYRVARPVLTPAQLDKEGWVQRREVPGFRLVSCIKRPLNLAGDADAGPAAPQVLQTTYSDGLTHVSVFIEPYSPQHHARTLETSIGATHTVMVRQGDWWFTVVGDVPGATLHSFAKAFDRLR